MGNSSPAGTANAIGLLPSTAVREPGAITVGVSLHIASPIICSGTAIKA